MDSLRQFESFRTLLGTSLVSVSSSSIGDITANSVTSNAFNLPGGTLGDIIVSDATGNFVWTDPTDLPFVTSATGGTGIRVTGESGATGAQGDITITNIGVTSLSTGSSGISISGTTGSISITNIGVTSVSTGSTGIRISNATGSVSIFNTGVLSLSTGSAGISISATTGSVSLSNTGVRSIFGTANQVIASGSTGDITLSLPQSIATGSNVQFTRLGLNIAPSYTYHASDAPGSAYDDVNKTIVSRVCAVGSRIAALACDSAGGNNRVGSTSNHSFALMTNNTEKMTIDSTGNVGINATPSVASKLLVTASSTNYYANLFNGTITETNNGLSSGDQVGILVNNTHQPTLGASFVAGLDVISPIIAPATKTIAEAAAITTYVQPQGNLGTVTNIYSCWLRSGNAHANTVANGYGLRVERPSFGTNKYTAYFDPFVSVGRTPSVGTIFGVGGSAVAAFPNYGQVIDCSLGSSSGTIVETVHLYVIPNLNGNSATVTVAYGLLVGQGTTANTITVGESANIRMPAYGSSKYGLVLDQSATVAAGNNLRGFQNEVNLGCSSGTLTDAISNYMNPLFAANTATITNATGLYINSGNTAGTITVGRSAYINMPAYGSSKYGINLVGNATVASANDLRGISSGINLGCSSGTLGYAMHHYIQPLFSANSATITSAYGLWIDTGNTAGTISTGYGLYVNAPAFGTTKWSIWADGNVRLNATTQIGTTTNGSVTTTSSNGTLTVVSDRRLKNTIEYFDEKESSLDKVLQLQPCRYKLNDDTSGSVYTGFIAQDMEQHLPDAVDGKTYEYQFQRDEEGNVLLDENNEPLMDETKIRPRAISDMAVIAHLVKAVQELTATVTTLTARIAVLEGS